MSNVPINIKVIDYDTWTKVPKITYTCPISNGRIDKSAILIKNTGNCGEFTAKLLNEVRNHVQKSTGYMEHFSRKHWPNK